MYFPKSILKIYFSVHFWLNISLINVKNTSACKRNSCFMLCVR